MSCEILDDHRIIWEKKPVLRAIYHDYYQRILSNMSGVGRTLEIGGGTGNLKEYCQDVVSTDIVPNNWLDTACDAQALPFKNNSFDSVVAIDVLHHIERPIRFFREAERVLKPGGRIILLEPAMTKFSWFFYHFLHPEPVIWDMDPLLDAALNPNRQPFDANQAIPELVFGKYYDQFTQLFPQLSLIKKDYFSICLYPLSGGFRPWSLIPRFLVKQGLKFERYFEKCLGKHIGFRLLLIIERRT